MNEQDRRKYALECAVGLMKRIPSLTGAAFLEGKRPSENNKLLAQAIDYLSAWIEKPSNDTNQQENK